MNRITRILAACLAACILAGCAGSSGSAGEASPAPAPRTQMEEVNAGLVPAGRGPGVCYEVLVYTFCDSDGDGIGDLAGLRSKLDYIESLGCTALWVLPVMPSPTYHKYDVTDYEAVDAQYGTMEDFEALAADCHERGMRLILDLPVNHTSREHPWFQEALGALEKGDLSSPALSFYNFRFEPAEGYARAGDGEEAWYYEARFWEGMPDLNLESETVRERIGEVVSFWLSKGVDGFRLDAVTSYFTGDTARNIDFLSWFSDMARGKKADVYLVGEAWLNQSEYAKYYASGIDSLFDFAFSGPDGVIATVLKGGKSGAWYAQSLAAEEELYASFREDFVNAPFYTNHDLARSTGYYAYDDGSRTKLAYAMNFFSTGMAFLYYGEELGMKGSGRDENKRAPMYWGGEGTEGLCAGPPGMDSFAMKFGSLEEQRDDPYSVWTYFSNAIRIRNAFPVIGAGRTKPIEGLPEQAACFERIDESGAEEPVLIAVNTGEESIVLSLEETGYRELSGVLTVGADRVTWEEGKLTLPGYGAAVLTGKP